MRVIATVKEMQETADSLRKEKRIGFVPTMGYLHEGHLALVRRARELADVTVVSIFVNPTQFGPTEDLAKYPRDLERDMKLLEQEKTDILFYPSGEEVYPKGYTTYVQVRGLEDYLCGQTRKGHFVGVATVVAKLFNMVKPHIAVFGQKDYQQLTIIERMVKDLNMDVRIIPHPTVREEGGLAMSSRNTYLSSADRQKALLIYASIKKLQELVSAGQKDSSVLKKEAHRLLTSENGINVEYVSISDPETLAEVDSIKDRAVYAVAVRIGTTRLIDNAILGGTT
ncbi:MAG TPA: pantoate--beta-alanine ligase [Syntrophorhabdales bacterium]|nr:pantoate--beta-alanine ligase [Syntrophorhabdales bacterium]